MKAPPWLSTLLLIAAIGCVGQVAQGQTQPFLFSLTFRGTLYETNGTTTVVRTPMTETSLLHEVGAAIGISDVSNWALVYHISGSSFGDTIDIVDRRNGQVLDTFLGFFFGSDLSLSRMALTNSANTQERRVDQLYTKQSPYALGSAFVTKRYMYDTKGNARLTVDADLHYLVRPQGSRGARFYMGSFTTTRPFVPR